MGAAPTAYGHNLRHEETSLSDSPRSIVRGTTTSSTCPTFLSPVETSDSLSILLATRLSATVGVVTITAFAASHVARGDRKTGRLCREPTGTGQLTNRCARIRSWLDGDSVPGTRRRWRRPAFWALGRFSTRSDFGHNVLTRGNNGHATQPCGVDR